MLLRTVSIDFSILDRPTLICLRVRRALADSFHSNEEERSELVTSSSARSGKSVLYRVFSIYLTLRIRA